MAAFHRTIVAIHEVKPNACVTTYLTDHFNYTQTHGLAKLTAGVEKEGKLLLPSSAQAIRVEDIPGGVVADYRLGMTDARTEIIALPIGRETAAEEGAALYRVRSRPALPVVVRVGDARRIDMMAGPSRGAWLQPDSVGGEGDRVSLNGSRAVLQSPRIPFVTGVQSNGILAVEAGEAGGQRLSVRFPQGAGEILIVFSRDEQRTQRLLQMDRAEARRGFDRYYSRLLASRIETPVPTLNQAFRSAVLTMDYNWLRPYGWNECIHHWMSLWHMQHSPAAGWLGQEDRSRECLLTHADNLLPNGAVPQFSPAGLTRRDFGGSNQFYMWQARHYWLQTADRKTVQRLAPALDRILAQTWQEYDQDGDGLLAWGQQIGNQEDYVSTPFNGTSPSIEGIQMLLTRAMIARALGDALRAEECERRASLIQTRLRATLWQPDLGRFAFYSDPYGMARSDGQYHTLIYPVIWGVLDPLDSWTSLRHLRERLTGKDGEVYCSNNFPWHAVGTWGMQAGAAQQPWAAWGLAAMGLREETFRPLKAVADWVMDANHRGSWPEISVEHTPAYFSPPAGLYIQSVIEALFGLTVNRPANTLQIAPSFPDSWHRASLTLPHFSASYRRQGNRLEYRVVSREPLARRIRWILPPSIVQSVTVNGKPIPFQTQPFVQGILLTARASAEKTTRLQIVLKPVSCRLDHPASIAEGDSFRLRLIGGQITQVEDRNGILQSRSADRFTLRKGLLRPYEGYGRLGLMNYARRSLFLSVRAKGVNYWLPVDLTILPRWEAKAEPVMDGATGGSVRLQVRNNTFQPLQGRAVLFTAAGDFPSSINIAPRSEQTIVLSIPRSRLALFSPGDNLARLLLPDQTEIPLTINTTPVFAGTPALSSWAQSRLVPLTLPERALQPDTRWRDWRDLQAYGHWPWANSRPPMESLAGKREITVSALPGVRFQLADRMMIPVSYRAGLPSFTLELGGETYRKLYLLIAPLLDNHDTFSVIGRVSVEGMNGGIHSRTLHFPGDLDWWCPEEVVGQFATAQKPRPDRFGRLPLLTAASSDWKEAQPPSYPQPEYWAACLPVKTPSSVLNVIELDLGKPTPVRSLTVTIFGVDPALGILAVSGEKATGHDVLSGTPWMPPDDLREPKTLFRLNRTGDAEVWQFEGSAFSVAPFPGLFTEPTLNSLAKSGENATGRAISPVFTVTGRWLRFRFQGGHSKGESGAGALLLRLLDAKTGEVLFTIRAPGAHTLQESSLPVDRWIGRQVRLELLDANTDPSYAWIGITEIRMTAY
jgi:hypothetical protein